MLAKNMSHLLDRNLSYHSIFETLNLLYMTHKHYKNAFPGYENCVFILTNKTVISKIKSKILLHDTQLWYHYFVKIYIFIFIFSIFNKPILYVQFLIVHLIQLF